MTGAFQTHMKINWLFFKFRSTSGQKIINNVWHFSCKGNGNVESSTVCLSMFVRVWGVHVFTFIWRAGTSVSNYVVKIVNVSIPGHIQHRHRHEKNTSEVFSRFMASTNTHIQRYLGTPRENSWNKNKQAKKQKLLKIKAMNKCTEEKEEKENHPLVQNWRITIGFS